MAALLSAEEVRERVLEDNEVENMDLDDESGVIENVFAETFKQPLQRLGKDLVNGQHFIDGRVKILVQLYHLIHNQVPCLSH